MPVVVEETWRRKAGVVVPRPSLPVKKEELVVVEIKLPTVSGEVVAISPVPALFAVMIPFEGNNTPSASVPDPVIGLPDIVKPAGTDMSTEVTVPEPEPPPTHVPEIEKQPVVIL